ncbi:2155_t:CDS:2 [Funneliformis caledonium]|uniref:2155_t:CDS:1 n=1 Tax=Funneliformis caledonium TaxID=1117310 RepID=A0A9N9I0R0_9GLOM|nr:2155_t:CDS:2 [Funneliformis caledonium]
MSNDYPGKTGNYKLLNNTGELPVIKILVEIVTYLNSKESSYWSFPDFLSSNFEAIVNFPPDTNDIKGLSGTWLKRFMLEAKAKGFEYKISKGQNSNVQNIFNDVISARLDILRQQNITILKSKAKIIADEKGINLVTASSEFHGSQMIAEYSQNPKQYINDDENIIESNQSLSRKRRDVDYKEDRDGYTTPCPNSPMVNNPEDEPKPKRRAKTDDKSCTSSAGTSDDMYKSVDDESEESEESDEEDELRLDVEEIGFEEYIDQGG